MINFIKNAISSVEGIADFRFYDDYKFSEEQGQLSYPCAVLQPIPSMTFNRNRQITDKMEIVLSIFEVTPKDYDGDTLYALQKKCADLMLQVLANLDVKTKFSDDVQVATILPEGDELLCGAMISLVLTMRQPRCIGAPSYIEVIVQPIKRENITSNGKHVISTDSGFNAMREVEVDVNVPQLTLEEKQVTITSNGTTIVTPSVADGMSKVEVIADVYTPPTLQDKTDKITENGTYQYQADSNFDGLGNVSVEVEVYDNFATSYQEDTQTIVITSPQYIETADNRRY